jgi:epoxyqueuosine reductase
MNLIKAIQAQWIKQWALELGFSACGIQASGFLANEARRVEQWLASGNHGHMSYMEKHFDKRLDTRLLVPGSKSVVSLLYNYFPKETITGGDCKISRYAYGEDYHVVVKDKMKLLMERIKEKIGNVEGRIFVDSAPVLERVWANKSGLGWIGKNTLLISPKRGSYFFLSELILDLELEEDNVYVDRCGTCTRCIDACPTEAITPYQVDGSKCISYFTIELKETLKGENSTRWDDWIFGCDRCQEVCPWNRFAVPHHEKRFEPNLEMLRKTLSEWEVMEEHEFNRLVVNSPIEE